MEASGVASSREEALVKYLLMERRKEGGRKERWEELSQTEKNGPKMCLKDNTDATFGPPQNSLLEEFVVYI